MMKGLISQLIFLIIAPCYGFALVCDLMPLQFLGRFMYTPPEIVQPKSGATETIDKVTIEWKQPPNENAFTKAFQNVQSYKLRVTSTNPDVSYNYETVNLAYTVHTIKSPGLHTATVASVGFFGASDWSLPVEFNVIIPKPPEPPKIITLPPPPMVTPEPPPPVEIQPRPKIYNTKLTITSPSNGARVSINNLVFQWTTVPEAHYYKLWIEDKSNDKLTYEYVRTDTSCNTCLVQEIGNHKAKVMAIGPFGSGTWSEEVGFEITQKMKSPRINKPMKDEIVKDEIDFEWSEVPEAKSYKLNVVGPSEKNYDFEPTLAHYKMKIFTNSGTYTAKVAAVGPSGPSDWSRTVPFQVVLTGEGPVTRVPEDMIFDPVSVEWMKKKCEYLHIDNIPESNFRAKITPIPTRTNSNGGKKVDVVRDEHSFFAAISHVISNSEAYKNDVRKAICQQILKEYEVYLPGRSNGNNYMAQSKMQTTGMATELEIVAAADLLETTIWVRDLAGSPGWWSEFTPRKKTHTDAIFLLCESNIYYFPVYKWT